MHSSWSDSLRLARPADLPAINAVVEAAVMAWPLPLRLRRLSVPVLSYDAADAEDYELLIQDDGEGRPVGIAAWHAQPADASLPAHALLHGLYVHPAEQRRGIGRSLQQAVAWRAREAGLAGMLVKAERVSREYFAACGYQPLAAGRGAGRASVPDSARDATGAYPYRFWLPLEAAPALRRA